MRLIEAGYIINRITEERRIWGDEYDVEQVLGDIEDAPTIEVEPVRHGKWEHDGSRWENRWVCSGCGYKWFFDTARGMYCPNCGAKMDGGGDDGKG